MGFEKIECVGCGHCCLTGICVVGYTYHSKGKENYGPIERCPSLTFINGRYWCQLVLDDKDFFVKALGIGTGCCQTLCNDWRDNVKFRG